ncbi:unnamed protein product [Amoebophrya sp. A25]|nr:unnamed protein product [Amoebophrya sp. A25]|eukprot:GSA25T00022270001.1
MLSQPRSSISSWSASGSTSADSSSSTTEEMNCVCDIQSISSGASTADTCSDPCQSCDQHQERVSSRTMARTFTTSSSESASLSTLWHEKHVPTSFLDEEVGRRPDAAVEAIWSDAPGALLASCMTEVQHEAPSATSTRPKPNDSNILEDKESILELLVIGAGPHALSLLTRLIDDDPDLLTEMERSYMMRRARRYRPRTEVRAHLKKRFSLRSESEKETGRETSTGTASTTRELTSDNVTVIDSHGRWMAQWDSDFEAFGIDYLRSHEHLHPDPFDFQALSVFAEMQKRTSELKQMKAVDRDQCRKAGYFGPFVTPSMRLFADYCQNLVERYDLNSVVQKGTVEDVRIIRDYGMAASPSGSEQQEEQPASTSQRPLFEVILADGRRFLSRRVVCAMGPGPAFQGMRATLPWWAEELGEALAEAAFEEEEENEKKEDACDAKQELASSEAAPTDEHEQPVEVIEKPVGVVDEVDAPEPVKADSVSTCSSRCCDGAASKNRKTVATVPAPIAPVPALKMEPPGSVKELKVPTEERLQHSCTLSNWLRDQIAKADKSSSGSVVQNQRVLVVGGGQTSAHLAQVALARGASSVTLCSRRKITRKPYDVDVGFVGDRRPNFLQAFWQLDDFRKRKAFNANLRSGGSMNADSYAELTATAERLAKENAEAEKQELQNQTKASRSPSSSSTTTTKPRRGGRGTAKSRRKAARADDFSDIFPTGASASVSPEKELVPTEPASSTPTEPGCVAVGCSEACSSTSPVATQTCDDMPAASQEDDATIVDIAGQVGEYQEGSEKIPSRQEFDDVAKGPAPQQEPQLVEVLPAAALAPQPKQQQHFELMEENEITQAHYIPSTKEIEIRFEDGKITRFDFVWLATGGNFDMDLVPLFASLQRQEEIPSIDGLPQLQADCSWSANVPLYVMGAFAQLQLGADALNLAGARSGGVVVARALLGDFGAPAGTGLTGKDAPAVIEKGQEVLGCLEESESSPMRTGLRQHDQTTTTRPTSTRPTASSSSSSLFQSKAAKKNKRRNNKILAKGTSKLLVVSGGGAVNETGVWQENKCECCDE